MNRLVSEGREKVHAQGDGPMGSAELQAPNVRSEGGSCKGCIFRGELTCRNNLRLGAPLSGCGLYRPYPRIGCICDGEDASSVLTQG